MKITYVANIRFPTEKAHGIQIAKTCEALVASGYEVELWIPRRETIPDDPYEYYGITSRFQIRRFATFDMVRFGYFGFLLQSLSFTLSILSAIRTVKGPIYCRDELVVAILSLCGVHRIVWESHDGRFNMAARIAARKASALVVVSNGLKDFYVKHGVSADRIHVIRNGLNIESFMHAESKHVARERLGLPLNTRIALYVGALDGWKGTDTLLKASQYLDNILVALIGGSSDQIEKLSGAYPQVRLLGPRSYDELPNNLAAADVLVLPNTAKDDISMRFTSPLKLFAYMASGVPIVASDLPSVRELIDDTSGYLVSPDDPMALATAITTVFTDSSASDKAARARKRVEEYSWEHRAERLRALLDTV